jgi:hypothetical protein
LANGTANAREVLAINWSSPVGERIFASLLEAKGKGLEWPRIAELLNVQYTIALTPDACRKAYARHGDTEKAEPTFEQQVQDAKTELVAVAEKRFKRREVTKAAFVDLVLDAFREIAPAMPPLPIPAIPQPHTGPFEEERARLNLGDMHGGEYLTEEETGGLGAYDWEATKRYAANLVNKVKMIVPRHNYAIKTLNLRSLGDMMTGRGIYPGQYNDIMFGEVEQVLKVAELIVWMIVELLTTFAEIIFEGVCGNHGRIGDKGESKFINNFDYLIYRIVQQRIENMPDLRERVKFNIPRTWWMLSEIYGHRYLLTHGDDIKGWNGISYYGARRYTRNMAMLLERFDKSASSQRFKDLLKRIGPFDEIEIGHHHEIALLNDTGIKIWINGAWPGGSMLSLKRMGTASTPAQLFCGVSRTHSTTWSYDLSLDAPP